MLLVVLLLSSAPASAGVLHAKNNAGDNFGHRAVAQLFVEHGSATVGRAWTAASSTSLGLPVLAAKGEFEAAQLVIVAATALKNVSIRVDEASLPPGVGVTVSPVGFVRVGPCPFDTEPASYNRTCPRGKIGPQWWCPTAVITPNGNWKSGCVDYAFECRGCAGMGPSVCCTEGLMLPRGALTTSESGPVQAQPADWCPNARGGGNTYIRPNDTQYQARWKYQPHALLENRQFDVRPGMPQPVMITFEVNRSTMPGNYTIRADVQADGWAASTTIDVTVWDFALPAGWSLPSLFGVQPFNVWGGNARNSTLDQGQASAQFEEMLLRHRIPVTSLYGHVPGEGAPGDWQQIYRQGVEGIQKLWSRGQRTYNLLCVDSGDYPGYQPNMTITRQQIDVILKARNVTDAAGWPRKLTTVYVFDEPGKFAEMVLLQNVTQEIAKAIGNETLIVTCGNQAIIEIAAQIGIDWGGFKDIGAFVPNMPVVAALEVAEGTSLDLIRARGQKVWWYTDGLLMGNNSNDFVIGVPPIRSRLKMGHLSWKYAIDGFLYYSVFGWQAYCPSPWNDCAITGATSTLEITGYMNLGITWDGEGQLAIPGPKGALPTLHLENVRDGFEDYELYVLARKVATAANATSASNWDDVPASLVGELPRCLRANEWCVPSSPISSDNAADLHTQRAALAAMIGRGL